MVTPGETQRLLGILEAQEGETIYTTRIQKVLGEEDDFGIINANDPRAQELSDEIDDIISQARARGIERPTEVPEQAIDHICAWYCPIHFFGYGWGIYIRESCILDSAKWVARFVDWGRVTSGPSSIRRQLLRSGFYTFFLHEQFHHKAGAAKRESSVRPRARKGPAYLTTRYTDCAMTFVRC